MASVVNLYNEQLKNIVVDLPCLEEQMKIANFLSNIDKVVEKEKLEELRILKK